MDRLCVYAICITNYKFVSSHSLLAMVSLLPFKFWRIPKSVRLLLLLVVFQFFEVQILGLIHPPSPLPSSQDLRIHGNLKVDEISMANYEQEPFFVIKI